MRSRKNILSEVKKLRQNLHQFPEPGFQESKTSSILKKFLRRHHLKYKSYRTGLTVDLGRPLVAIRTDIDGLPVVEKTGFRYRSKHRGYMHACGHDFHMAITTLTLLKLKERGVGGVRAIYQPSEEGPDSGAKFLIRQGVLRGIKAIFALHLDPSIPLGKIAIREGTFMAAATHFKITIQGKASHAALPHLGNDTICCASRLVTDLQVVVARKKHPIKPGLITVGKISGGERFNILAKETVLEGTIRALDMSVLKFLKDEVQKLCRGLSNDYQVKVTTWFSEDFPPVVNSHKLVEIVFNAATSILGRNSVLGISATMGSEDFSYYQMKIPGVMFMLGVKDRRAGPIFPLHHERFWAPDKVIEIGSEILYRCCCYYLS